MKRFNLTTIKSFVWRAAFIMLVLVLFTTHFASGFAARYVTSTDGSDSARVAKFSYSAKINSVSALSFTNTDFWATPEGGGESVAMNTLRSIDLTVNNYNETSGGVKTVSEVAMRYSLEFVVPVLFGQDLAFQLLDGSSNALLPQIVMTDLLSAGNASKTFNTSDSTNYNAELIEDISFTMSKNNLTYTATSGDITITVEEILRENVKQTLYFRVWDVSSFNQATVSDEGGTLIAPLEVDYATDLQCFKISISMPSFTFSANSEQSANYKIRLTPTMALNDGYLKSDIYENGTMTKVKTLHSGLPLTLWHNINQYSITALAVRHDGIEYTEENKFNLFTTIDGTTIQKYFVSDSYSKTYPMQVKALFEQID